MKERYLSISESLFKIFLKLSGGLVLGIPTLILLILVIESFPSLKEFGFSFFKGTTWNPVKNMFGALPFLTGTLLTSFIAIIIAVPFSISVSVVLGEYLRSTRISTIFGSIVELLASIPSVIYGLWGLLVLVPLIRKLEIMIGVTPYGVGIFSASLILSIMIIPYASSVAREVIQLVPNDLKEAAYSLGGTRYEVVKQVILPNSKSGIFAGILLALGRALGETMAVTMVIGNTNKLTLNIFKPSNTMASVIANEFTEAVGGLYLASLIEIGFFLFIITMIINIIGRIIIKRLTLTGNLWRK